MTRLSSGSKTRATRTWHTEGMKNIPLALTVALAAVPAWAGTSPKVSREAATKAALASIPGARVESAEHEHEDGHDIWSFDMKAPDGLREVWVDAKTGAVISNVLESAAEQGHEKILDRAEEVVKARIAGEVLDSRLSRSGRESLVTIRAKDGRVLRATVSAAGRILGIKPARAGGEKAEADEKGEKGEKGESGGKDEHGEHEGND